MNDRTESVAVILALAIAALVGGCSPEGLGVYLANREAESLYAEIGSLAADRSSTDDGDCALVGLACGAPEDYLVYSRATVDEEVLLEKVRRYNEALDYIFHNSWAIIECSVPATLPSAISENGVCVAGSR